MWPTPGRPPPGRHPHAGRHGVDRPGVDRRGPASVSAPSRRIRAKAKGWSSGCCTVGRLTQRPGLDGAGRADVDEVVGQLLAAVSGSHSSGGHSTRSPLRMPMIRWSASAVMKAPITGPSDRLYGNLIVDSTDVVTSANCFPLVRVERLERPGAAGGRLEQVSDSAESSSREPEKRGDEQRVEDVGPLPLQEVARSRDDQRTDPVRCRPPRRAARSPPRPRGRRARRAAGSARRPSPRSGAPRPSPGRTSAGTPPSPTAGGPRRRRARS